nr:MAG TPA: accessory regulator-like protein [Caudoviricetes sp.]
MFIFEYQMGEYSNQDYCYLYFKNQYVMRFDYRNQWRSAPTITLLERLGYIKMQSYDDTHEIAQYELTDKGKAARQEAISRRMAIIAESDWLHDVFAKTDRVVLSIYQLTAAQRRLLHAFALGGYVKADIGEPADDYDTYTLTNKGRNYIATLKLNNQ